MDGRLVGLIGGIVGGIIGVMGGIVGTYFSIKNTHGPKEKAFAIRAAALGWLGCSAFLACLLLVPLPWRVLLWVVCLPLLFWFICPALLHRDRMVQWNPHRDRLLSAAGTTDYQPDRSSTVRR